MVSSQAAYCYIKFYDTIKLLYSKICESNAQDAVTAESTIHNKPIN